MKFNLLHTVAQCSRLNQLHCRVALPVLLAMVCLSAGAKPGPDERATALLAQMTLDEKIGQMVQADMNALVDKTDVAKYAMGSVLSGGGSDPADMTPAGWAQAVAAFKAQAQNTRLKIPLLYGIDAVHGDNNVDGAVIFPHNIGLGATRNSKLVARAARITALETRAIGVQWAFAPCIAVARDARWGRTYESFGETPELAAAMGAAAVRGFQDRRLSRPTAVLACAKHFAGDGGTQNGVDQGNTVCDEATFRRLFLAPYEPAIKAGVGSIMVSFNSWNGVKMSANRHLLTDVLKGKMGFQGFLVSDWAAIDQLAPDYKSDIEQSINAGMDMIMIPYGPTSTNISEANNYVVFINDLKELVAEGKVPQARIDDAVRRILRVKFQMGLFDRPDDSAKLLPEVGSAPHRQVARECVRQSLVLLKNENHALPLPKKIKCLAVVGTGADDIGMQCGGWTIDWQGRPGNVIRGGTTLLAAVRQTVSAATQVIYSPDGSNLAGADAIIAVVGEPPYAEMKGDRTDLQLSAADQELIARAKQAGVPVITLLYSGRPLVLGRALESSDAFVAAWLPGTEGRGLTDVLFGDNKPKGKLPRTWPRANDQLPELARDPAVVLAQFPYGFGLTY